MFQSEMRFPEPCILIKKYSKAFGAKISDNLRITKLRIHITTICAKNNITSVCSYSCFYQQSCKSKGTLQFLQKKKKQNKNKNKVKKKKKYL